MPDGRRRSREGWADTMEAAPAAATAHVHRLPPAVRIALVGLCGAVLLLCVAVGLLGVYVYQANQYVQGRGEYRDREAARMEAQSEARIREALCDLLEQLPASELLDTVRGKYGCGPGLPVESFSPEVQQELNGGNRSRLAPPPVDAEPRAPMGAPATPTPLPPEPSATVPEPAPPAPAPAEPTPAPGGLLDPITDPLCDALNICL